ncbi:hypothetical protein SEPCBS119000_006028 [Sporothrix epigloea]|uniref:Uncharacterized protein n=1 Tax=Sporothrix epigloea TaxID=1892477 RepID=A0ABP0E0S0_9PEZI
MHFGGFLRGSLVATGLFAGRALAKPLVPEFFERAIEECPAPVTVQPIEIIGQTPVIIDVWIPANTVIIINEITIQVTNAPTQISTTITTTVTTTSTVTT